MSERLAQVHPEEGLEGRVEVLRLLTERREDLVAERTRALNRLHVLLRDLLSDGVAKGLSAEAAAKLLRRARPNHACAPSIGRSHHWTSVSGRRWRLPAPTLTEVFGVGSILAAKTMSSIVGTLGGS